MRVKKYLKFLYQSSQQKAVNFRYGLMGLDIIILLFLFISSFSYGEAWVEIFDIIFGSLLIVDFLARLYIQRHRWAYLSTFHTACDVVVIISLMLPLIGENFAFLRVARVFRLLHSYRTLRHLREDVPVFRKHEDIIISSINLLLFIFLMTALVFETQAHRNDMINNYLDALYFTVTTLTTTGFGDVTLIGNGGRVLAILIMIIGVSLFLRLIQTIFRPNKVRYTCEDCALYLHDRDASHCKHCGNVLHIPDAGLL